MSESSEFKMSQLQQTDVGETITLKGQVNPFEKRIHDTLPETPTERKAREKREADLARQERMQGFKMPELVQQKSGEQLKYENRVSVFDKVRDQNDQPDSPDNSQHARYSQTRESFVMTPLTQTDAGESITQPGQVNPDKPDQYQMKKLQTTPYGESLATVEPSTDLSTDDAEPADKKPPKTIFGINFGGFTKNKKAA